MGKRRLAKCLVSVVLMAVAGFSLPSKAEMVYRFEPSLELVLMHDGDLFGTAMDEELSDQLGLLRPVLPLVGESERTKWGLVYSPEAAFYNEYSDLDRFDHRAELTFDRRFSPRSNWELGGTYLDTSDAYSDLLAEDIITTQTDRQLAAARTAYSVGVSRRVDLTFSYDFQELEYRGSELSGYTSHEAAASAGLITSPRTVLGLEYSYQNFSYPGSGDYDTHNLLTSFTARPTEKTTLILAGGAYFQEFQAETTAGVDPANQDDTGFIGSIEWGMQGRRTTFDAGLIRSIRASGGLGRSVLSHALRLSLEGSVSRRVSVDLSGLFQLSEPTITSGAEDVEVFRSSLGVNLELNRIFGLRCFADYILQQWEDETRRDLNYPRVGLSLMISTPSREQ